MPQAIFIEEHDDAGTHWIVSLSGQPNPEPEDAIEVATVEDAKRLVTHWNRR